MGSHPAEVRIPPLPIAEARTRFSDPRGMQGWVDLRWKRTGWKLNQWPVTRKFNALPQRHHTTPCRRKTVNTNTHVARCIRLPIVGQGSFAFCDCPVVEQSPISHRDNSNLSQICTLDKTQGYTTWRRCIVYVILTSYAKTQSCRKALTEKQTEVTRWR